MSILFERFTEAAIKVIMLAQQESRRLAHNFVGTEQILLGLIACKKGIPSLTLDSFGVTLEKARFEVEKIIGRGTGCTAVEIPFTPRAKRALEAALKNSQLVNCNYIGPEHLLLGVLDDEKSVALMVLHNLNVDTGDVRRHVLAAVGRETPARNFMVEVQAVLGSVEELRDNINSISPALSKLHACLGGKTVASEVLQEADVQRSLRRLQDVLGELVLALKDRPPELFDDIASLQKELADL